MKRTLNAITYLAVILSLLFGMPFAMDAEASGATFRTTAGVNLRAEANTNAAVVRTVNVDTDVTMLSHNPSGWSRVQIGDSVGFIRSDFLRLTNNGMFSTTAGVNVRERASTDSGVVRTVNVGADIEVVEHNPAGWSRVRVGDAVGYVRSDFLKFSSVSGETIPETGSEAPPPADSTVIATMWTTGNVNFRSEGSASANIISTLSRGTSVEVLENQSNGWSRVRHGGTVGFVSSNLISESAPTSGSATTLRTRGSVNLRASASASSSLIRLLARGTSVEVLENQSNGWSRVRHDGREGFIRSDLLTDGEVSGTTTLRTNGSVNFRTEPSANSTRIDLLSPRTSVEVIAQNANGWSRVRHNGREGFIRSDLLSVEGGGGVGSVELLTWQQVRSLIPMRTDMRVVDVRTGITFNLRAFSLGGHADVEPPTRADTDAIFRSRNGVWAWSPRPVWVTIGNRTFAAALNGMPHAGSTISGNGMNGHLCLHFAGTVTRSQSYQRALRAAVQEAFDARPR
ncbi:MAG: SH3 domain-containing protein [Oscillospiraceae bacterium]|nr:SH3 domain-containing protein [Oscillospiraceae bacterium]MCL2278498.1 SH3 domain-containing protein [Oscillospiraceae bacterium]